MSNTNISNCMQSLNCCREFNRQVQMDSAVSCSLKRKRPPRLEIPSVLREIRADGELECRSVSANQVGAECFSAPGVAVCSIKGKKTFMEDTHKVVSFPQDKKGFFGVYDGHGGSMAAEYVADHLDTNIYEMLENCSGNAAKEDAIKAGYLKTDQDFLKHGISGGASCVTALIEGKDILVSNLGDCRAVLCRGGMAESLTKDHTAGDEDEQRRIQDQGGYVEMCRGAWRVQGMLAVSRSIGDAHLKDWVLAEPETKTLHLTPDMGYLVLASDGLWKEVSNQEAVNIVKRSCIIKKKGEATVDENGNELSCTGPWSKLRRALMAKGKNTGYSAFYKKPVHIQRENEVSFSNENEVPRPMENSGFEVRRLLDMDPVNMVTDVPQAKTQSPNLKLPEMAQAKLKVESPLRGISHLKEKATSDGLMAACKELANLAVMRGSLDDITVLIIDLHQFQE